MKRRIAPLATLAIALLFALPVAAKDEKPAAPPMRVAVFPPQNNSEEEGATRIMEDIMRDQLKKIEASRATFLWPLDVERALSDHDQLVRIDQLNERWGRSGQIDSAAVSGLDSLLMVDAILLVQVREWENHRVPVVGAGQSHTTVALSFALVDPRTRKILWTKTPREQRFAAEMDASSSNINYDETGVIQRKSDNAPPRYEIVAADLVRDAFKKFPRG